MKKKYFLIIIFSIFLKTSLHSQTKSLTLKEAIDYGLKNNLSIQTAQLGVTTANKQIDFAYNSTLPKVDWNARYIRNIQKQVFYFPNPATGVTAPIKIGSDNSVSTDISVSQLVFNSAALKAPEIAKEYSQLSQTQVLNEASAMILNIRKAYLGAMFTREVLNVQELSLKNLEEVAANTKLLAQKGIRPEFDAIRAQVQVDNQKPQVTNAKDAYSSAIDFLKLSIGLNEKDAVEIKDTIWVMPENKPLAGENNQNVRSTIEQNNPQLQQLKLLQSLNEKLIEIKKSDYLPTVAAFATYQLQTQFDGFSQFSLQPTSYIGLNATWNIFNANKTRDTIEIQKLEIEKNKIQFNNALNAFATQSQIAARKMESAKERILTSDKTIQLAEKGFTIAATSYKAGAATQLQVNDAELALSQARLLRLNAIYDYNTALAEFDSYFGNKVVYENFEVKVK